MKPFRTVIAFIALAAFLFCAAGCTKHEGTDTFRTPYEIFNEKFAEASTGKWTSSGGVHTVTFNKGSLTLDPAETRVVVCTPDTWPVVVLEDGSWRIDGADTGIALASGDASDQMLLVFYDGEGIFVRLSSGKIIYFYESGAADVGCFRFERALNPSLPADVICRVTGITISGDLGRLPMGSRLIPTFGCRGTLTANGSTPVVSSVTPLSISSGTMSLKLTDGTLQKNCTLSFSRGMNLPVIRINTEGKGEPTSKEEYITVKMTIEDEDMLFAEEPSETEPAASEPPAMPAVPVVW